MKRLCLFIVLLSNSLYATDKYISPSGSDANPGTSSQPYLTFAYATNSARLTPGDRLLLKDGTYTRAVTGMLSIDCNASQQDGTSGSHITIRAENERRAYIRSDGSQTPIYIVNCSYWDFYGIHASSADFSGGSGGVMDVNQSDHLDIRRMLLHHPNGCVNDHALSIFGNSDNLTVEENEVYDYYRHGIAFQEASDNAIVRFNYANSRNRADASCRPAASDPTTMGDSGFVFYPSSNSFIENNITENVGTGFDIEASSTQTSNGFYGNVNIGGLRGIRFAARGSSLSVMPQSNTIKDFICVDQTSVCIYPRGAKSTTVSQVSVFGDGTHGLLADCPPGDCGDSSPSTAVTNFLVKPAKSGYDYYFSGQSSYSCNYCAVRGNVEPALTNGNITNEFTTAPTNMDQCYVHIPSTSNLYHVGSGSASIGGEFLYEYLNGTKTSTPLWNANGFIRRGAIVNGVNDIPGTSLYDVHERLRVNSGGCALPSGYPSGGGGTGSGGEPPDPEPPDPPDEQLPVTPPTVGPTQILPNAVTISWVTDTSITSGTVDISYSFDNFTTSYTIATGIAYNASPYIWATPTWPASTTMKVRIAQGATTRDSEQFTVIGQYLK